MKVAIYGGTFDPVHNGHLIIATKFLEILNLDKLIIMPAFIPPHKVGKKIVDFSKRYEWLKKAFQRMSKVEISSYEKMKGGISYTFETVGYFEKIYASKITYIVGEDNFLNIDKWYRYEELLEKVELWVYPRSRQFNATSITKKLGPLSKNVHFATDVPLIQISSSEIRKRIKNEMEIRGYVPFILEEEIKNEYKRGD